MIVMTLSVPDGSIDRVREMITVVFNANDELQTYAALSLGAFHFVLHEVQQVSSDPIVAMPAGMAPLTHSWCQPVQLPCSSQCVQPRTRSTC